MTKPIIIAGFGRSGTTWLSDIVSKALGGIILFEPFHPCVFEAASEMIYRSEVAYAESLRKQWEVVGQGKLTNRWILRNHLRSPLTSVPESYIEEVWDQCDVIGFKTIRANHLIGSMTQQMKAEHILYIIRHPLAVLASINNRPQFWKEFGWPLHFKSFVQSLEASEQPQKEDWLEIMQGLTTDNQRIIWMWTVSQAFALPQVDLVQGQIIAYEEFYMSPFEETKKLLKFLGVAQPSIHPSYIFEPSLTTHRTFHNSDTGSLEDPSRFPQIFWEDQISQEEAKSLLGLISIMKVEREEVVRYLEEA